MSRSSQPNSSNNSLVESNTSTKTETKVHILIDKSSNDSYCNQWLNKNHQNPNYLCADVANSARKVNSASSSPRMSLDRNKSNINKSSSRNSLPNMNLQVQLSNAINNYLNVNNENKKQNNNFTNFESISVLNFNKTRSNNSSMKSLDVSRRSSPASVYDKDDIQTELDNCLTNIRNEKRNSRLNKIFKFFSRHIAQRDNYNIKQRSSSENITGFVDVVVSRDTKKISVMLKNLSFRPLVEVNYLKAKIFVSRDEGKLKFEKKIAKFDANLRNTITSVNFSFHKKYYPNQIFKILVTFLIHSYVPISRKDLNSTFRKDKRIFRGTLLIENVYVDDGSNFTMKQKFDIFEIK